jgi:DNA helicase-2/ATP-dependent DNA helicase PcrA
MNTQLTQEQQAVIGHPTGRHARVLAVAGSGKTTTMVHRVAHLLKNGVPARQIGLLMFNRLAREQFEARLRAVAPSSNRPYVYTFHAFAYTVIKAAIEDREHPRIKQKWFSEHGEESRRLVLRLIQKMENMGEIAYNAIDAEEVLAAIGLWKGSLVLPEHAGYRGNRHIPTLYERFEETRREASALTFDDFVPNAVRLIEHFPKARARWTGRFQHLLVDEYQDVNLAQQRLIELLAGNHADVMVVGDDDQTIYEWRGARPGFILTDFSTRFTNRPVDTYTLSRSFRFGPVVAQCAENTVRHNERRAAKRVLAHFHQRETHIQIFEGEGAIVNRELADAVEAYINGGGNPQALIVLGRLYSQMNGLELEFLSRQIPYRVEGGAPLLQRHEVVKMLSYGRLAARLTASLDQTITEEVLATINTPNRMLRRADVADMLTLARRSRLTLRQALEQMTDPLSSPFGSEQRTRLDSYTEALDVLAGNPDADAGEVLDWLVRFLDFDGHFDEYYGFSEAAEDRKRALRSVCEYAHATALPLVDFLAHVDTLDTTGGAPPDRQIVLTSIHRVKGLEYDVVVIPDCTEGYLPCLVDNDAPVYDTRDDDDAGAYYSFDAERRLFYVAITRARGHLWLGTVPPAANPDAVQPSAFITEMALGVTQRVLAAARNGDEAGLVRAVRDAQSVPGLVENLTENYLPAMGYETLASRLRAAWERGH